jgi:hypothetical protein
MFSGNEVLVPPSTGNVRPVRLAQLGTFDVSNYGDLLYPIVLRRALSFLGFKPSVYTFSPFGGLAPESAGYSSDGIRSLLMSSGSKYAGLVVGGGDLLRTDWSTFSEHYRSVWQGTGGATVLGKWSRVCCRFLPRRLWQRCFRQVVFGRQTPGPFFVDTSRYSCICKVAYWSCGVHNIPFPLRSRAKRLLERAAYVYVRDRDSARHLRDTGYDGQLVVAPDAVVLVGRLFDRHALFGHGQQLFHKYGLRPGGRVLVLQMNVFARSWLPVVAEQCAKLRSLGWQIACVPTAYCSGLEDDKVLSELSKAVGEGLTLCCERNIFGVMAMISAASVVAGTSLHANVTAFSLGVPHIFLPLAWSKLNGFIEEGALPRQSKLKGWDELADGVRAAYARGDAYRDIRARAQQRAMEATRGLIATLF